MIKRKYLRFIIFPLILNGVSCTQSAHITQRLPHMHEFSEMNEASEMDYEASFYPFNREAQNNITESDEIGDISIPLNQHKLFDHGILSLDQNLTENTKETLLQGSGQAAPVNIPSLINTAVRPFTHLSTGLDTDTDNDIIIPSPIGVKRKSATFLPISVSSSSSDEESNSPNSKTKTKSKNTRTENKKKNKKGKRSTSTSPGSSPGRSGSKNRSKNNSPAINRSHSSSNSLNCNIASSSSSSPNADLTVVPSDRHFPDNNNNNINPDNALLNRSNSLSQTSTERISNSQQPNDSETERAFLLKLQYFLLVAAALTLVSILIYSVYYITLIRRIYAKDRVSE